MCRKHMCRNGTWFLTIRFTDRLINYNSWTYLNYIWFYWAKRTITLCAGYFTTLSLPRLHDVEWQDDSWIGNNLEITRLAVTEVVSERTEDNQEKPQSGHSTSWQKFRARTFRRRVHSVTAMATRSATVSGFAKHCPPTKRNRGTYQVPSLYCARWEHRHDFWMDGM